jgi:DNA-binding transcriptional LysR family regulator
LTLRNVGEVRTERRGQVIVSMFPTFSQETFPKLVRRFREDSPNVVIQIRHGCNLEVVEDISSGVADFGVAFINNLPDTIHCVHLRQDPLLAIVPWSHPLAKGKDTSLKLAQLRDVDFVSLAHSSHTQRLVDGAAQRLGFALRSVVIAPAFQDVIQLVRAGAGLGIVPNEALPKRRDFAVRSLKAPSLSMSIGVIRLRGRYLTPASTRLMKMFLDHLKGGVRGKVSAQREVA